MNIKRIKELYEYKPSKGIINEAWGDVDTSSYICIGEVDSYYPWADNTGKNKLYIMASPEKVMKWGQIQYDVVYTENNDGTGKQTSDIPSFAKQYINIYPEHQDNEYGEIFLGKRKDNDILKQMHKEFQSLLFKIGNKIVIHHNSSYRITDGFVKKGKPLTVSSRKENRTVIRTIRILVYIFGEAGQQAKTRQMLPHTHTTV